MTNFCSNSDMYPDMSGYMVLQPKIVDMSVNMGEHISCLIWAKLHMDPDMSVFMAPYAATSTSLIGIPEECASGIKQ